MLAALQATSQIVIPASVIPEIVNRIRFRSTRRTNSQIDPLIAGVDRLLASYSPSELNAVRQFLATKPIVLSGSERECRRVRHVQPRGGASLRNASRSLLDKFGITFCQQQRQHFHSRAGRKPVVGLQSSSLKEDNAESTNLARVLLAKLVGSDKQKQTVDVQIDESTRERYLTGDPNLSEDERARVKMAFLEGIAVSKSGDSSGKDSSPSVLSSVVRSTASFIFMLAVVLLVIGVMSGSIKFGIGQMMGISQHEVMPEEVDVSFEDVRGCDEAKEELQEVVEYLRNPERYSALGGRLPKGVLLMGPPGTGKTLLGRAIAGEAQVPFFHAAGSEFDEVLVGQGARRVRELFAAAKSRQPCVIFIDEIDAVGSKRTSSALHPHANQTINQLLSEMDGFHQNDALIVIGATNRMSDLDKALTRPGRFDVQVTVAAPDVKGRADILNFYLERIRQGPDVDVDVLARCTIGFTGADLENLVNQAALRAASHGQEFVTMEYFEHSRERITMGPEKKTRIPDETTNRNTAIHEAGHTIVAYFSEFASKPHKVTIMPRGQSLGHTAMLPEKDQYDQTRSQLLARLDVLMGGRAAEELIIGQSNVTSGASNDLKNASDLAKMMIRYFGMSDRVGLRSFASEDEKSAWQGGGGGDVSPAQQEIVDAEIRRLLAESYDRAKAILRSHSREHRALAAALLDLETLDANDIKAVMEGRSPDSGGSGSGGTGSSGDAAGSSSTGQAPTGRFVRLGVPGVAVARSS